MPSKQTSGSFFPFYKRKFAQHGYVFFVYSKIESVDCVLDKNDDKLYKIRFKWNMSVLNA